MRKLIGSVVIGLALVAGLMVFVAPSLAFRPLVEGQVGDRPPVEQPSRTTVGPPEQLESLPRRARNVSLSGIIAELPDPLTGTWAVTDQLGSRWTITVTAQTKIVPPGVTPSVGDPVHVVGSRPDDDALALQARQIVVRERTQVRARPHEFHGVIEYLPTVTPTEDISAYFGIWVVSGCTVTVNAETMIHPDKRTPEIGMRANVIAFEQEGGTLWAKNIALHRPDEAEDKVEIEGTIKYLSNPEYPYSGTWIVDRFTVTITDATEFKGATPALSLTAKVEGQEQSDGSILAHEITVQGPEHEMVEFEGTLRVFSDTRPSEWIIDTDAFGSMEAVSVTVTDRTHVHEHGGTLAVGVWVEVKALRQEDGDLIAVLIKVEDGPKAPPFIQLKGTVVVTDAVLGDWVIETVSPTERITVHISSQTQIVPPWAELSLGASVEVKAIQKEDGLHALWIKVETAEPESEELEFVGTIAQTGTVPGDWVINNETVTPTTPTTVHVTNSTVLEPDVMSLTVGALVEVKAKQQNGGTLQALWIKLEEDEDEDGGAALATTVTSASDEPAPQQQVAVLDKGEAGMETEPPVLQAENQPERRGWLIRRYDRRLGGPIERS